MYTAGYSNISDQSTMFDIDNSARKFKGIYVRLGSYTILYKEWMLTTYMEYQAGYRNTLD